MVCGMRLVRLVRGECGRSASHRAVDRRPRVNGDDAALLPRESCGAEERGGGDSDAVGIEVLSV